MCVLLNDQVRAARLCCGRGGRGAIVICLAGLHMPNPLSLLLRIGVGKLGHT